MRVAIRCPPHSVARSDPEALTFTKYTPNEGVRAIYADGGICGMCPTTRSDVSDRQLCYTWCRLPRYWRPCFTWGSAPY
eukprot:4068555-Pleurochrysis_carterae.AAC.1